MSTVDIFSLEKRFDLQKEYSKIEDDLIKRKVLDLSGMYDTNLYISFYDLINLSILKCPFNESSRNLEEYFDEYGINGMNNQHQILMKVDFFINYILWIENSKDFVFSGDSKKIGILPILKNCKHIIEQLNYKIAHVDKEGYSYKTIIIIKRDYDVDSVLNEFSPDLRIQLLTYLDFRTENNVRHKENIIKNLYNDLESKESELDVEPNRNLFKTTKFALNYPRHHHENKLSDDKRIEICDKGFYLYIHLVRSKIIGQYQKDIKKLSGS